MKRVQCAFRDSARMCYHVLSTHSTYQVLMQKAQRNMCKLTSSEEITKETGGSSIWTPGEKFGHQKHFQCWTQPSDWHESNMRLRKNERTWKKCSADSAIQMNIRLCISIAAEHGSGMVWRLHQASNRQCWCVRRHWELVKGSSWDTSFYVFILEKFSQRRM